MLPSALGTQGIDAHNNSYFRHRQGMPLIPSPRIQDLPRRGNPSLVERIYNPLRNDRELLGPKGILQRSLTTPGPLKNLRTLGILPLLPPQAI